MSAIEEAYAKYAKGFVEHKLNLALERLDEQGRIIGNMQQMILKLQEKIEILEKYCQNLEDAIGGMEKREDVLKIRLDKAFDRINAIQDVVDHFDVEENDIEKQCENALDAEFIKQQLFENYQLLEKIDKYIRL
jgi:chromosome segregation ATPase